MEQTLAQSRATGYEESYLIVLLHNKIRNEEILRRTKVTNISLRIIKFKWHWAEHIARRTNNRCGIKVICIIELRPRAGRRRDAMNQWHIEFCRNLEGQARPFVVL